MELAISSMTKGQDLTWATEPSGQFSEPSGHFSNFPDGSVAQ